LPVDREFWLERWRANEIGFHRTDFNPLLVKYWPRLGITRGSSVFVPLCGKSLDMRYLESLGHHVYGVELAERAVRAYFEEGGEEPRTQTLFYLVRYEGAHTTIYCGDFFDLASPDIMGIRGVYDRGALVALPPPEREKYADHLQRIIPEHAHILLLVLEYDQDKVQGPPFSIAADEVVRLFSDRCRVECIGSIETSELPPKFKQAGIPAIREAVYHLVKEH
jgi:thiopurine S-methyltransferase